MSSIAETTRGAAMHWNGPRGLGLISCSGDRCATVFNNIRAYHMANGWIEVAYNHLTCPGCGRTHVGRGWGVRSGANGTTAANREWHAWMVMYGGNEPLTLSAKTWLHEMNREHLRRYGRSRLTTHRAVRGGTTECPGPEGLAWIAAGAPVPTPPDDEEAAIMAASMLTRIDGSTAVYQIVGQFLIALTKAEQAALIVQHAGLEKGRAVDIVNSAAWRNHVGDMTPNEAGHFTVINRLSDLGDGGGLSQSQADSRYAPKSHRHTATVDLA